jgi:CBS domain containing-hemolysin-like protein
MSVLIVIIATVALMIFLNGFYVAAEFATVSARRTRVSQMAGQGNRMAQRLLPFLENSRSLDDYVAACQVGITISSLVIGAYGQNVIAARLITPVRAILSFVEPVLTTLGLSSSDTMTEAAAASVAATVVLIGLTILQVIMGELFPKSVAIQFPEQVALGVVVPMKWSLALLRPLIWLFNGSGTVLLRLMGRSSLEKGARFHSPEEIELLVTESHEGGLLDDTERQMLRNAFRFRELTARQVMLHRTKLVVAPSDSSIIDLMNLAIASGYSRIPIYRESVDDITGFVHVKDLFRLHVEDSTDLESVVRGVVYVPETLPVVDVWERLSSRRKYLAIVFDEYGGTAGLITFEDLIEEIFGELQDEFDDEMALVARDKEGRIYLRGDLLVSDVNEYLELSLPDAADTLSGLIFSELGRPPRVGDEIQLDDTTIRVEAMADPGVSEISLQLPPSEMVIPFSEWEVAEHE